MRMARLIGWVTILSSIVACSATPRTGNVADMRRDQVHPNRARIDATQSKWCGSPQAVAGQCNPKKVFVGVAISGGGSRAANYSAAVLSELDAIGLLGHVDAISSVSGGSLTAAYLAAKLRPSAQDPLFWHTAKNDLSQNFRTLLLQKLMRPDNFINSLFGSLGRTELMAEVFDETIFHQITYGEMAQQGFGLLLNATAVNNIYGVANLDKCTNRQKFATSMRWESIPFSEEFFNKCLYSTLDTYRLARAVTASAAFPGLFSSVPLAVFRERDIDAALASAAAVRQVFPSDAGSPSQAVPPQQYLHVIDGGPSDNLGVEGLLGPLLASINDRKRPLDKCLIVIIDAFGSGDIDRRYRTDDTRSALDRLVDSNFFDSIDAMLYRRREETLKALGLPLPNMATSYQHTGDNFPVPGSYYDADGLANLSTIRLQRSASGDYDGFVGVGGSAEEDGGASECLVWYTGLDRLREMVMSRWEHIERPHPHAISGGPAEPLAADVKAALRASLTSYLETDRPHRINDAWELATRVRTDFNLVGPKNCSGRVLSDALWIAGKVSVDADIVARRRVCRWLDEAGLARTQACDQNEQDHPILKLPVKYKKSLDEFEYEVECE